MIIIAKYYLSLRHWQKKVLCFWHLHVCSCAQHPSIGWMTNVLTKRMCRRRSLQRGAVLACTVINIVLCLMLAAGLLPFALGSETWGSIVCPASTVGVTAYRPTGGTIPNNGMLQVCTLEAAAVWPYGHVACQSRFQTSLAQQSRWLPCMHSACRSLGELA